jgi:hypothetical protein
MTDTDEVLFCHWCGEPVLPETCVILKTTDQSMYLHWECFGEAQMAVRENGH